ncbi:MAG: rhamnan synthesis F family protein, partial [Limnohabitans sp.]
MFQKGLVIAHFHKDGKLRSDTISLLQHLSPIFDRIVLVSTCLTDSERKKLPTHVTLHVRPNTGYDFYSYRYGIKQLQASGGLWQITVMNTSFIVQQPQLLASQYFEKYLPSEQFDVLGLTHSFEVQPHLQSYLLTFSSPCTRQTAFIEWWNQMTPVNERHAVVFQYELGLSAMLQQCGMTLTSAMPTPKISANNPSHFYYKELLQQFGIVKIELLKSNPFELDLTGLTKAMGHDAGFAE